MVPIPEANFANFCFLHSFPRFSCLPAGIISAPQLTQRAASPSPLVAVAQVHEGVPGGGSVPPDREPPHEKLENGVQLRLVTGEGSGLWHEVGFKNRSGREVFGASRKLPEVSISTVYFCLVR